MQYNPDTQPSSHGATKDRFWMVHEVGGPNPTFCHETFDSAIAEAQRLAQKYRENRFVILQAIANVEVAERPVTVTIF